MTKLSDKPDHSAGRIALITLAAYVVAEFSRDLLYALPFYAGAVEELPRFLRWLEQPTRWCVVVLIGLYVAHRLSPRRSLAELGLTKPVLPALLLGFACTLPMLIPALIAGHINPELDPLFLLYTGLVWPLGEEILYRGYVFRQLHRRAGWGFWPAALLSSLIFGLVHLGQAAVQQQPLGGQIGSVAMIAGLSVLGAWIFTRWDDNLWVMVVLHGLLNLYWDLFDLADNPLGGLAPNLMRLACVVVVIVVTLKRRQILDWLSRKRKAPTRSI